MILGNFKTCDSFLCNEINIFVCVWFWLKKNHGIWYQFFCEDHQGHPSQPSHMQVGLHILESESLTKWRTFFSSNFVPSSQPTLCKITNSKVMFHQHSIQYCLEKICPGVTDLGTQIEIHPCETTWQEDPFPLPSIALLSAN